MLDHTELFRRERSYWGTRCTRGQHGLVAWEFGGWHFAAGASNATFWKEALKDPDFKNQVEPVLAGYLREFGESSPAVFMRLRENLTTFVTDVGDRDPDDCTMDEDPDDFTMMAEMGFFVQKHPLYRMSVPFLLASEKIRADILKYAKPECEQVGITRFEFETHLLLAIDFEVLLPEWLCAMWVRKDSPDLEPISLSSQGLQQGSDPTADARLWQN